MIVNRVLNPPTLENENGIYYVKSVDGNKEIYIISSVTGEKVLTKLLASNFEKDNIIYTVENYKWDTVNLNLQPTGNRASNGAFSNLNYHGYFWTSDNGIFVDKTFNRIRPTIRNCSPNQGNSIRLVRLCTEQELLLNDGTILNNIYIDNDDNGYDGVKVEIYIFLLTNLKVRTYSDNSPISTLSDNVAWKTDSVGALAIYPNTEEVLYNNYSALEISANNITEWHIPSLSEWNGIISFLDGYIIETIDNDSSKIRPTDGRVIDARHIVNLPDYDNIYEPRDPNIQAHIVEIGNPHDTTAELVGAVRKNNPITAGTHSKIQYDEKGLVIGGSDIDSDDVSDTGKNHKFVSQTQIDDWNAKTTIGEVKSDTEIADLISNSHEPHSDDQDLSIYQAINETNAIAKGKVTGYVFETKNALDIWLTNPENIALLQNGDNLYIIDINTPDYWWDYSQQIYHILETSSVDLSGYVVTSRTINSKALTSDVVLNTDDIAESVTPTNKWWTNSRTISSVLTAFSSGAGTVSASDTILEAIQKIVGNIALKLDKPTQTKTLPIGADSIIIKDSEDSNKYKDALKSSIDQVWVGATPPPTDNYTIWINPTVTQLYTFVLSTSNIINPNMDVTTYKVESNYAGGNTVTIGGYTNLPKIDCEKSIVIKNTNASSRIFVLDLSTIVADGITYSFVPMNISSITIPSGKFYDSSYKFISTAEANGKPTAFSVLILFAIQE